LQNRQAKRKNKRARNRATNTRGGFGSYRDVHNVAVAGRNIVPDEMDVVLAYPGNGIIFAAAQTSAKRWTPNAPYDVDPTLGSTSTPGFSEWAGFYSYVRCEKYEIEATVVNLDTSALDVYFVHSNTDPGTVGTNYQQYATAAFGKTIGLSPKGGMDRATYRQKVNVGALVGGVDVSTDDSFRALTSTTPADLVYFGIGAQTMTGGNMVTGLGYTFNIRMWCKFYGRKNNLTTLGSPFNSEPSSQETPDQAEKLRGVLRVDDDGNLSVVSISNHANERQAEQVYRLDHVKGGAQIKQPAKGW